MDDTPKTTIIEQVDYYRADSPIADLCTPAGTTHGTPGGARPPEVSPAAIRNSLPGRPLDYATGSSGRRRASAGVRK